MRVCRVCQGDPQPLDNFYRTPSNKTGYETICKSCKSAWSSARHAERKGGIPSKRSGIKTLRDSGFAVCTRCKGDPQPLVNFYPNRANQTGYCTMCKPCNLAYQAEYTRRNKDHIVAMRKERAHTVTGRKLNAGRKTRWRHRYPDKAATGAYRRRVRKYGVGHSPYKRSDIYARDNGTCQECGKSVSPTYWHLDHYIPLAKGGTDTPGNVRTCCVACNHSKGDSYPDGSWTPS